MSTVPKEPTEFVYAKLRLLTIDTSLGIVYNNGKPIGNKDKRGYWRIWVTGEKGQISIRRCHVIFWAYHGRWPIMELDHEDRNKDNESISNLKEATRTKQQQNRSFERDLPVGVYRNGSGYQARYQINNVSHCLGTYPTPEQASTVYQKATENL